MYIRGVPTCMHKHMCIQIGTATKGSFKLLNLIFGLFVLIVCLMRAHFSPVKCYKNIFPWGVAPTNPHVGVLPDPPLECVLYKMPQVPLYINVHSAYTTRLLTKMSTPRYYPILTNSVKYV